MPSLYNNADSRFLGKTGADKNNETQHNSSMAQPLTIEQTAAFLQISRKQIYRLFDQKLLRGFHIGRKHFVSAHAIKNFIKEREENEQ